MTRVEAANDNLADPTEPPQGLASNLDRFVFSQDGLAPDAPATPSAWLDDRFYFDG